MSRRLFWQIYAGFVAIALLCVAAGGVASLLGDREVVQRPLRGIAELVARDLPRAAPGPALQARAAELGIDLALFDEGGVELAKTGDDLAGPAEAGFVESVRWRAQGSSALIHLADGRWLASRGREGRPFIGALLLALGLVFLCIAAVAWPLARRITRRLEALGRQVDAFGAGDLAARAAVAGQDEVARLASHFNAAADRIEALVAREKRMLAHASHELRSPLTRLRMGLELMLEANAEGRRARYDAAIEDVAELDALIGDLLLASRLDAGAVRRPDKSVALHTLVAGEAARAGVRAEVEPVTLIGDEALLVRLVRNLVDNALRHGGAADQIAVSLGRDGRLTVDDRGPGVPEAFREAIFEPFFRLPGHAEGDAGGVGIGLSLVRHIAELHGGEVRALAREGGGSRFEVRLPLP